MPAFYIARHELTWHEYFASVRAASCPLPAGDPRKPYELSNPRLDDNHPVTGVSFSGIQCYISWINKKTGETYRIPTPAEWEYAARAGTKTRYPWGDDLGYGNAVVEKHFDLTNAVKADVGRLYDPRPLIWSLGTLPVESAPPNPWGIYDMIGNALEATLEFKEGPKVCLERFGSQHCRLIAARGGEVMSFGDTDLTTVKSFRFANLDDIGWGYRLVRSGK